MIGAPQKMGGGSWGAASENTTAMWYSEHRTHPRIVRDTFGRRQLQIKIETCNVAQVVLDVPFRQKTFCHIVLAIFSTSLRIAEQVVMLRR